MIVSVSLGEDIEVVLDDEMAGCWSPTRAHEMCDHAVALIAETLAACKASATRTVKARTK